MTATRSELLARRSRIALASQGRDLMTEKRAALMLDFSGERKRVLRRPQLDAQQQRLDAAKQEEDERRVEVEIPISL